MITSDWHMHSRNSCDCRDGNIKTTMAELVTDIGEHGILDFGITDHIHTPVNLPDLYASRAEFDLLPVNPRRHFGVEVSVVSSWEIAEIATGQHGSPEYGLRTGGVAGCDLAIGLTEEEKDKLKIEYVVGGTHWPMYVPVEREDVIRDYHRQYIFLASHPMVTIIAHPWWWMGKWQEDDGMYKTGPWFDDFKCIPQSIHTEFADAVKQYGKVVEINLHAIILNNQYPDNFKQLYAEYIAGLHAVGVTLSTGSDHHSQHHNYRDTDLEKVDKWLASVGLQNTDFWRLTD